MLFRARDHEAIVEGTVDLAFRRWAKPSVRPGGTQVMPAGVVGFDEVTEVDPVDITDAEAVRAGRGSAAEVRGELERAKQRGAPVWRIRFHWVGPDPRAVLREQADLGAADVEEIDRRLDRFDAASRRGPWTAATLAAIERAPATHSEELAAALGQERMWMKSNVRKLKGLGLTQSLRVGYRLSKRGEAYVRLSRRDSARG